MEELEEKVDFVKETDKFIRLFKEFEKFVKQKCKEYGIKKDRKTINQLITELTEKDSYFKIKEEEIKTIRTIRNINSHEITGKYQYNVYPNPKINNILEKIIDEIKKPPMIYDTPMCIKKEYMSCKTINDSIYETIKIMSKKNYTHIPILENEKIIGVFSENTLLDVLKDRREITIDGNTKFTSIEQYLKIEKHSMEKFIFVSKRKNIYDIEEMFKNYFSENKRIGCIFVTKNGNSEEDVLGMLTAWDVLGN